MVAQSVLRELQQAHVAYFFVIEGTTHSWTDQADLAGTDYFGDGRTVHNGLIRPVRELAIDIFTGEVEKKTISITLLDTRDPDTGVGVLADLFATFDTSEVPLEESISPTDSLAARTELHDKYVGTEHIGSSGERHREPAILGTTLGLEHIGEDFEPNEQAISTISDNPVVMRGRRVALYKALRDIVTFPPGVSNKSLGWAPVAEVERVWFGTLSDAGRVDGRRWTLLCEGPRSYLRKTLGGLSQTRPTPVRVRLALDDTNGKDETGIGITFWSNRGYEPTVAAYEEFGTDAFTSNISTASATGVEVALNLATALSAAEGATGPDGEFNDILDGDGEIRIDTTTRDISIRGIEGGAFERYSTCEICLHEKVWRAMGYDPQTQSNINDNSDPRYIRFKPTNSFPTFNGMPDKTETPGDGYYSARFSTHETDPPIDASWDNGGNFRLFSPKFNASYSVLPADPAGGLLVQVGEGDNVWHTGQLDQPIASDPNDFTSALQIGGTDCDTQGLWLITGKRAFSENEEPIDEVQIARASWVADTHFAQVGTVGDPREIIITEWMNPRSYGIDRPRLTSDWHIVDGPGQPGSIEATPVFHLGYKPHSWHDEAHLVIQRILYSTGLNTGWTGFQGDPAATQATTSNEPVLGLTVIDAEVSDLGLRIPKELIHPPLDWATEYSKIAGDDVSKLGLLIRAGTDVEEIIPPLFRTYGWSWHLRDGMFGIFSPSDVLVPEDADVTITQSEKRVDGRAIGNSSRTVQELRTQKPIDAFTVKYRYDIAQKEPTLTFDMRSPDKGARYRTDGIDYVVEPRGIHTVDGLYQLFSKIARFWEKRHFMIVGYPVKRRRPGQDIWPGARVLLTEPRIVVPSGSYGATSFMGIITRIKDNLNTEDFEVDIFVQADGDQIRYYAPIARGKGIDTDNNRILCYDNEWLSDVDPDYFDVNSFVEPATTTIGGDADIVIRQWNGSTWAVTATQSVTGVNAATNDSYLQLAGAIVGTYERDKDTIVTLDDYDTQTAAWALAYFGVICDQDGEFGTGPTKGFPWL